MKNKKPVQKKKKKVLVEVPKIYNLWFFAGLCFLIGIITVINGYIWEGFIFIFIGGFLSLLIYKKTKEIKKKKRHRKKRCR